MKLHLPTILRTALLASMAVFTPLTVTIGSATLMLSALSPTLALGGEELIRNEATVSGVPLARRLRPTSILTWLGGNGDFSDSHWDSGSGVGEALQEGSSITFTEVGVPAGGAAVNLDASYSLTDMTVTATGSIYTFTQTPSSTLTLSEGLTVTGGATASFAFHPVLGAGATVTIGANSSLSFTSADELSLNSLSNEGSLTTSGALVLTSAPAQGGTISAASLALATDTANSFSQLTITGKVTNTGTLSVSGTSSMGSLAGEGSSVIGGSLEITSGASLSVGDSVIIRALSNEGSLSVTGGLNILSSVSAGGNITVGTAGDPFEHLRVAEGNNSFGTAIVHGNVIGNTGILTIGDGSKITGSIDSGSLSSSGTVEVGSLSIAQLINTGTLTTTGDVTLSEGTALGGIIDVATALSITGANTFTSVEAQSISSAAAVDSLSVAATSSTGSIGELNLGVSDAAATFSITGTGDVTLSSFNGAGSLSLSDANAGLTLKATSTGKDLTLPSGNLTLGAGLSLTGNLITSGSLTLTLDYQPDTSITALNAQAITGASSIRLNLNQARLEALGISNATSYKLTSLKTDLASGTTLSFNDTGDDEWIIGSRTYTLGIVGGELNISVVVSGNEWQGTGAWDDQTSDWTGGTLPSALTEAFFFGGGERDVQVAGAKTVNEMEVSSDYSFRGDEITTGVLKITGGTTTFHNSISVTDTTTIATDTRLTIEQSTDTDTASLDTAKLIVNARSSLEIAESGNATVWSAGTEAVGTIYNHGEFTLHGDAAASDGIAEHQIASLQSSIGSVSLQNNAEAKIGELEQANVSIGAGSTLTVTGYGDIYSNLMHQGMIDASMATDISVAKSSGTGDMDAQHLILHTSGSTLGTLRVNELSFHGSIEIPTTRMPATYLTVEDLSSLSGSSISLDVEGIYASLPDAHYTLVRATNAASTLDWTDVTLNANTVTKLNELIRSGKDVSFSTGQGELAFTVAEATERRWYVSQNSANTPGGSAGNSISPIVTVMGNDPATGAIISGQLVSYSILDTVQDVIVDVNYRLDLSHLTRSDTDLDGAVIRNLSGDNSLGLIGKGNEGTASETSLVTLENSELTAVGNLNLRDIIVKTTSAGSAANLQVNSVTSADSTLSVEDGSTLQITDTMTTIDSEFTVAASGSLSIATLDIKDSSLDSEGTVSIGHAVLADGVTLSSAAGDMEIQKLTASNDNGATIGSTAILSGQGGLLSVQEIDAGAGNQIQGAVTLGSGSYLGSYDTGSSVTVTNKEELLLATSDTLSLAIENGSTVRLQDAGTNTLQKLSSTGGSLTLQTHGLAITESSNMMGGTLSFTLNAEDVIEAMAVDASDANAAQIITSGSQLTLDGTHIIIEQSDNSILLDIAGVGDVTGRVLADLNSAGTVASITLDGAALNKYFMNVRYSDGQILADINFDVYTGSVSSANGLAGAQLMNSVLFELNPQLANPSTGESKHPDLKDVLDSMDSYIAKGDSAAADELAAAFAGASVTAMGGAMLGTVERQLGNIRNRAFGMSNRPILKGKPPTVQAWINAEGSISSLDADGTAAGYDYNSFGGSVGVDFSGVEKLNYGLALTALYGSLTADAPDSASGDLNSYGLSAYAQVKSARWTHSFIATVNLADAKLDRTVPVQGGSYSTTGDTNGYGVGLMYEAAYSYKIGEDEGSLLQPLVNLSFVHATLDGYTEQGGDAALTVGEQESSYLTLGVGARVQTSFGARSLNRAGTLSLRAMVEADLGDRYTTADMSLSGVSGTQTVTGAEPGNFGGEIGVGLNIPVGHVNGAIFMDASVEFRQAQSDVNATVGYSFSF